MIKCTNCSATDERPVFRTNPLGAEDAGWMCKPCIVKLHDASVIDPEIEALANDIASFGNPIAAAAETTPVPQESNMVRHAKAELQAAGMYSEDVNYGPGEIAGAVLELVEVLAKQGHSGGSHGMTMAIFNKLANFQNLAPLTNNPAEWNDVCYGGPAMWQSSRRSDAFSTDGGITHYLLDGPDGREKIYTSKNTTAEG